MPLTTQNVDVPLGAGLNEATDERRLDPPHALQAQNAIVRNDQAYEKTPGWADLGVPNTGGDGARALLSDANEQLLAAGQANMATYSRATSAWSTYGDGFTPPVSVTTTPTSPFRGQLLDVGIAHHKASLTTAIFANHSDGCVAAVYSDTGDLLAGPFTTSSIGMFPRVEATTDGSGNAVFIFLGCSSTVAGTAGLTTFNIYQFVVNMSAVPTSTPTENVLLAAVGPAYGLRGYHTVYDTHSVSSHDYAYMVGYNGASLVAAAIKYDGTIIAGAVKAGGPTELRIFHDEVSETVLLSETGTWDSMFYANESLTTWTEVNSLHVDSDPHIYKTYLGTIFFSGESLTMTGTGPAVPTLNGYVNHDVTGLSLRRPQPWLGNSKAMFFHGRNGGTPVPGFDSGESVAGIPIAWSEATSLNAMLIGTDDKPYPAVPILQSLHGTHIPDGYINRSIGERDRGHVPQSALMADGSVLLAEHVAIPAAKLLVEDYGYLRIGEDFDQGHGGNMDHRLLVVRLSPEQSRTDVSSLDVGGSTLAAMGGVHGWDGQVMFDVPGPPFIADYDDDAGVVGTVRTTTGSEIHNDGAGTQTYSRIKYWSMRVVVVFTDRLGNEWRSSPSPVTNFNGITGDESDTLPKVTITLGESHQRVLQQGGGYDLELYVSERDEGRTATADVGAATEAEIIHNFWLAQRSPLLFDGTDYYVADYLKTAMSSANANIIGDVSYTSRTPVPLYTDSGELAPSPPPACNLLASAGNYCFLAPSERKYDLLPSKPLVVGIGPEFPPELMIRAPAASGGIVSIAGQGDRLVLLCARGVYELYAANGPDATGDGGFGPMRQVQRGDGCVNRRATVSTPMGVFYAAASGIKQVSGNGVQSIGRGIQRTLVDPLSIVSAIFREASREVWWFTDAGTGVCLNLESGVWTSVTRAQTSTGPAILSDGTIHQITVAGTVHVEDATVGDDSGGVYEMSVASPWLSFDASQSWFRCRRGRLHGVVTGGSGDIVVELSYDYDDTVVDTFRAKYLGAEGIPNLDKLLHIRFRPSRQKFDALKIRIYDTDPTSTDGAVASSLSDLRWSLTGLELEVAAKRGGIKLQAEASK